MLQPSLTLIEAVICQLLDSPQPAADATSRLKVPAVHGGAEHSTRLGRFRASGKELSAQLGNGDLACSACR